VFVGPVRVGLVQHLAADAGEQHERDPVVVALDHGPQLRAQHPADEGHEGLKATEEKGHDQDVLRQNARRGEAPRGRHRRGVHGQTDGEQKNGAEAHVLRA
jgi:hypothetical protein